MNLFASSAIEFVTIVAFLVYIPQVSQGCKYSMTASGGNNLGRRNVDLVNGARVGRRMVLLVRAKDLKNVTGMLEQEKRDPQPVKNLETVMDTMAQSRPEGAPSANLWSSFWKVDDIHRHMDKLASENADVASIINLGCSGEGRDLKVMKIGYPSKDPDCPKIGVFIDAGYAAREWASISSASYIIHELITNKEKHRPHLESVDFYVHPVANPDGYDYTHKGFRFWRKSRSLHTKRKDSKRKENETERIDEKCVGVDLTRNFAWRFGFGHEGVDDPCSEEYEGTSAFSEPETSAVHDFLMSNKTEVQWQMYINIRSYGQAILYPYLHSNKSSSDDAKELQSIASAGVVAAKAVNGQEYKSGKASETSEAKPGGSADWAKGEGIAKYSFILETRPNDDPGAASIGFVLPPNEILPAAQEVFAAVTAMAQKLAGMQ